MQDQILNHFIRTHKETEARCKELEIEDYSVQPIIDVSPPKWHLAHSTWFFEQFVLVPTLPNYEVYDPNFAYLFNSYYNSVGERVLRPDRGLMTRPTVKEVYNYRRHVTDAMIAFLKEKRMQDILDVVVLGINHEEQHQELLIYDIKYILGHQPFFPKYETNILFKTQKAPSKFITIKEGVYEIGHMKDGFSFDNELSPHKVYLNEYSIATEVVTNQEFIAFIESGGYANFALWHADGWDFINKNSIQAPLYWHKVNNEWHTYHFDGLKKVSLQDPVTHISYYEAYAFANWKKMRLPTEFEWEIASNQLNWGAVWEWTGSAYLPYPGFATAEGAIGEYNGKFMVNQHVLRGASIATAKNHSRNTYRNFFNPNLRWLFAGIRLAK